MNYQGRESESITVSGKTEAEAFDNLENRINNRTVFDTYARFDSGKCVLTAIVEKKKERQLLTEG